MFYRDTHVLRYQEKYTDWHPKLSNRSIKDFIKFYSEFFVKFGEIRKEALSIDDRIFKYYQKWFNALLSSLQFENYFLGNCY